ncbi:MAG: hypothetical protein GY792_06000 [Gammaproteobacteria bacterium]|nr:hypothetical protein [Gammaproteobacteria bacterium]
MIEKSESNQLSLATAPILGQAPSEISLWRYKETLRVCSFILQSVANRGWPSSHYNLPALRLRRQRA